ncbi:hypothetical protein AQUCO_00900636v1 [Aquilegia coerulea]|uniref:Uncharacterized protein n=1 Tax=Aquilegia coerulea TaxID=218851 RepID=A0A2G5EEP1_AQUCA|nr:hypothetical protein AQUCO_00900636v1 [Aquilegia coerulea]
MEASKGVGFMAVFAVSGSVVLLSLQLHKRLLSDFMKKVESELGGVEKVSPKRKVRFAEDVVEPSSNNKEYRMRHSSRLGAICDKAQAVANIAEQEDKMKCNMPPNRRALYEGVLRYRALKGHTALHCC